MTNQEIIAKLDIARNNMIGNFNEMIEAFKVGKDDLTVELFKILNLELPNDWKETLPAEFDVIFANGFIYAKELMTAESVIPFFDHRLFTLGYSLLLGAKAAVNEDSEETIYQAYVTALSAFLLYSRDHEYSFLADKLSRMLMLPRDYVLENINK